MKWILENASAIWNPDPADISEPAHYSLLMPKYRVTLTFILPLSELCHLQKPPERGTVLNKRSKDASLLLAPWENLAASKLRKAGGSKDKGDLHGSQAHQTQLIFSKSVITLNLGPSQSLVPNPLLVPALLCGFI